MQQLVFKDDVFLKSNKLKEGHCYLYKDGRLAIYLGKDKFDSYIFYTLGCCLYERYGTGYGQLTIAYYEHQINSLISLANNIMNSKINVKHISNLKGIPKLYTEFPFINFENTYFNWYSKNKVLVGDNLPILVVKTTEISSGFVKTKDLVPGQLYYTGSCWRACYVYLGRDSANNFCWYFIGNFDVLFARGVDLRFNNIDRTGSNKRCRLLAFALRDPHAYVDDDVRKAVAMNFSVDVSNINLG